MKKRIKKPPGCSRSKGKQKRRLVIGLLKPIIASFFLLVILVKFHGSFYDLSNFYTDFSNLLHKKRVIDLIDYTLREYIKWLVPLTLIGFSLYLFGWNRTKKLIRLFKD
jgi:hypothetical protein